MKLICSIIFLNVVLKGDCQKFQHEQYPYPPQFQTPNSPLLSSDSTIYLPPESSSPIPYYAMNNIKKLPVKFLPPTAVKTPQVYPTPYPIMFSSSQRPNFDENDNQNGNDIHIRRDPLQLQTNRNVNMTDKNSEIQKLEKRESRTIPMVPNYQQRFENAEKAEMRKQSQFASNNPALTSNLHNQNPASRRNIVTSEFQRNDNGQDQMKSASFTNPQYIQPLSPGLFLSSTTEPAIPIIRLSNEMDLDGSFSYEALGADQTHYVQHSRMENMGSDKEEQVVEGSYSYVGDNGQTYTVHYIADSNGYRASGDHLPVPPPIPEIIQRAIQYNLAEEAKKPPHLRQNWENESTGTDFESENTDHRYTIAPFRNLFTGRTPEAFSFGFAQNPPNSLISLASSPAPVKTNYDMTKDQNKPKSNAAPITPQITFLASQGAHSPSSQIQQTSSRLNTPEKSTMPQLINYEAGSKDTEQEANKALWRWQYGLNSNENQNPTKNTISRSFGEGDDIIINFSDMTPEQYKSMIQTQIMDQNIAASNNFGQNSKLDLYQNKHSEDYRESDRSIHNGKSFNIDVTKKNSYNNMITNDTPSLLQESQTLPLTTEKQISTVQQEENTILIGDKIYQQGSYQRDNNNHMDYRSKIISRHNFAPTDLIVTQSYTFEDTTKEPIKIYGIKENSSNTGYEQSTLLSENDYTHSQYSNSWQKTNNRNTSNQPIQSTPNSVQFSDYIQEESEKSDFKPVTFSSVDYQSNQYSTTKETDIISVDELIRDNIFLKNLFRKNVDENNSQSKTNENHVKNVKTLNVMHSDPNVDKFSKPLQFQTKTQNEIKHSKKKPLDMNDVLNFVAMKNGFESSKMKPKNKPMNDFTQNFGHKEVNHPIRYIPTLDIVNENDDESDKSQKIDTFRTKDRQHQHEHGVLKNYKVLQRHKNVGQVNMDHQFGQDLSHRNIKMFPGQNLPPLGRAGPSVKSYLPPTYL